MLHVTACLYIKASSSGIPVQYRELAEKAISNSKNKIAKELREDTQYPGYFEGSGYHFRLTKIATGPLTNDIKGYAIDGDHCAIVKRKAFNITDKFVFLEPSSQKIYKMKNLVGNEANVDVYESKEISIFDIMTDFEMKVSTAHDISDKLAKKSDPLLSYSTDVSAGWDDQKNKPIVYEIPHAMGVKAGMGGKVELKGEAILSFKSIFDIKLTARVQIDVKVGLDIIVPKIEKKD